MRRYKFSLDAVLRVRRVEEDSARLGLAHATRAVAASSVQLNQRLDHYDALPMTTGALGAEAFLADRSRREMAAASVVRAGTERLVAVAIEDERRSFLQQARTRVAALERLDDRRRAEHALEAQLEEIKETDDIVTTRFARAARSERSEPMSTVVSARRAAPSSVPSRRAAR